MLYIPIYLHKSLYLLNSHLRPSRYDATSADHRPLNSSLSSRGPGPSYALIQARATATCQSIRVKHPALEMVHLAANTVHPMQQCRLVVHTMKESVRQFLRLRAHFHRSRHKCAQCDHYRVDVLGARSVRKSLRIDVHTLPYPPWAGVNPDAHEERAISLFSKSQPLPFRNFCHREHSCTPACSANRMMVLTCKKPYAGRSNIKIRQGCNRRIGNRRMAIFSMSIIIP
jgi:hypothetical protein